MPFARSLPVLMYHYVNDTPNSIGVAPKLFEEHCRVLAKHGWRGVSLADAEDFFARGKKLPARSVLFTFDDGYLDNYMHAMPLLHKYGHQGVMFAVADRVEAEERPRAAVADVLAGSVPAMPELHAPIRRTALGYKRRQDIFCNRGELRAMDEGGIMAVASHSRGHLGVFAGPEYNGFVRPGNQGRTFYGTGYPQVWGMPAFTVTWGLSRRAFIPDPDLVASIQSLVPQDEAGANAFFAEMDNLRALEALTAAHTGKLGRFETDGERTLRMRGEIVGGKVLLESLLGHEVHSLCWPWGQYCDEALSIGRAAGFSVFLTTREGANPPGRPLSVRRFKAKARSGAWLLNRIRVYSQPLLGDLYAWLRL